jgi:hypothetical protein
LVTPGAEKNKKEESQEESLSSEVQMKTTLREETAKFMHNLNKKIETACISRAYEKREIPSNPSSGTVKVPPAPPASKVVSSVSFSGEMREFRPGIQLRPDQYAALCDKYSLPVVERVLSNVEESMKRKSGPPLVAERAFAVISDWIEKDKSEGHFWYMKNCAKNGRVPYGRDQIVDYVVGIEPRFSFEKKIPWQEESRDRLAFYEGGVLAWHVPTEGAGFEKKLWEFLMFRLQRADLADWIFFGAAEKRTIPGMILAAPRVRRL